MAGISGFDPAGLRVSDADRDGATAELSEHFQAGRLTAAELDDRLGQAMTARTRRDLDVLFTDLPAGPHRAAPVTGQPSGSYQWPASQSPADQRPADPWPGGPGQHGGSGRLGGPVRRADPARWPYLAPVVSLAMIVALFAVATRAGAWELWWLIPVVFVALRRRRSGSWRGGPPHGRY